MRTAGSPPVCLNVSMHIDERFGGLATSLPRFSEAVTETGRFRSKLVAFCEEGEVAPAALPADLLHRLPSGRAKWLLNSRLRRELRDQIRQAAVVHIHGLWQEHSFMAARICREVGVPYVVSAHGMLEPWAMKRSKWKKRAYFNGVERGVLAHAAGLRALTQAEATFYRGLGLTNPVEVVPNGIDPAGNPSAQAFHDEFPHLNGKKLILFVGRLHPKKGLDVLCRAWSRLETQFPGAHLVIAGPDEDQTLGTLVRLSGELGLDQRVTFTGMLRGSLKWSALAAASVFVLPSFSEGFSMAVLEALSAAVPVVISSGCHFPEIVARGCGWQIEPEEDDIIRALSEALSTTPADLSAIGNRGRAFAEQHFSWTTVGQNTADFLDRMVGRA